MDRLLPFLCADFMGKPAWIWLLFFAIPRQYRHHVLFWGILRAQVTLWKSRKTRTT